jgi:hypothetical protein
MPQKIEASSSVQIPSRISDDGCSAHPPRDRVGGGGWGGGGGRGRKRRSGKKEEDAGEGPLLPQGPLCPRFAWEPCVAAEEVPRWSRERTTVESGVDIGVASTTRRPLELVARSGAG